MCWTCKRERERECAITMRDDDGEHVRRTSMYPLQSPMIWIVFFFNGGHWKRLRDDTVHDTSWNNSAGAMPSVTTCGFSERLAVPERWRASALTDVSDISREIERPRR